MHGKYKLGSVSKSKDEIEGAQKTKVVVYSGPVLVEKADC